jgi:hypothetical protein
MTHRILITATGGGGLPTSMHIDVLDIKTNDWKLMSTHNIYPLDGGNDVTDCVKIAQRQITDPKSLTLIIQDKYSGPQNAEYIIGAFVKWSKDKQFQLLSHLHSDLLKGFK